MYLASRQTIYLFYLFILFFSSLKIHTTIIHCSMRVNISSLSLSVGSFRFCCCVLYNKNTLNNNNNDHNNIFYFTHIKEDNNLPWIPNKNKMISINNKTRRFSLVNMAHRNQQQHITVYLWVNQRHKKVMGECECKRIST